MWRFHFNVCLYCCFQRVCSASICKCSNFKYSFVRSLLSRCSAKSRLLFIINGGDAAFFICPRHGATGEGSKGTARPLAGGLLLARAPSRAGPSWRRWNFSVGTAAWGPALAGSTPSLMWGPCQTESLSLAGLVGLRRK